MVKFLWHKQRESHKLRWKTKPESYFKWRNKYNFLKNIKCPLCKKKANKIKTLCTPVSPHIPWLQLVLHTKKTFKEVFITKDIQILILTFMITGKLNQEIFFCCGIHFCKSYAAHKVQNTGFSFTPFFSFIVSTSKDLSYRQKRQGCRN